MDTTIQKEVLIKEAYKESVQTINGDLNQNYDELTKLNSFEELKEKIVKKNNLLRHSFTDDINLYKIKNERLMFTNQFINTIHIAYYHHFPLCFSPDDIQLLIIQGFCTHIKLHAEKYRNKFVNFQGQQQLKIIVNELDRIEDYKWEEFPNTFSKLIKDQIGQERYKLCVHKYTTTNDVAQVCYEVSLMDTMQKYFKYVVGAGCGISKIKLLGTLQDWQQLRQNVEPLREFDLDWWIKEIIPILDQFINLYQGNVDKNFWENIYRFQHPDPKIYDPRPGFATGWITYFFPYRVNENASINDKEPFVKNEFSKTWDKFQEIFPEQFPSGVSKAPVTLEWQRKEIPIQFCSGYFGITLLDNTFLKPQLGWAILELNLSKVQQTKQSQKQQQLIPKVIQKPTQKPIQAQLQKQPAQPTQKPIQDQKQQPIKSTQIKQNTVTSNPKKETSKVNQSNSKPIQPKEFNFQPNLSKKK
ncbi:unnamed protein product [Paramecium sonneborni]|uniref:Uncharacterized protein n=1 Tax=Paramecium sonneborni TaxID=65129 RepID=A0A8S1R050_9CILI|nr:unnamed protein product [Paramecium sonneborni]